MDRGCDGACDGACDGGFGCATASARDLRSRACAAGATGATGATGADDEGGATVDDLAGVGAAFGAEACGVSTSTMGAAFTDGGATGVPGVSDDDGDGDDAPTGVSLVDETSGSARSSDVSSSTDVSIRIACASKARAFAAGASGDDGDFTEDSACVRARRDDAAS